MAKDKNKIMLSTEDYRFVESFMDKEGIERGMGISNLLERYTNEYIKNVIPRLNHRPTLWDKAWFQTTVLVLLLLTMYAMGVAYGWT